MGDVTGPDGALLNQCADVAIEAMNGAVKEDWLRTQTALDQLRDLVLATGSAAPVQVALQAWADAYVQFVAPPPSGKPIRLGMVNLETGDVIDVDSTNPAARWAGRWVIARGTMDHDTCDALYADLCTRSEADYNEAIQAVLQSVAACIRAKREGTFPQGLPRD